MHDNQNSRAWLVGVQNGRATLEDGLTASDKVKHTPTKCKNNQSPKYLPEKNENLHSHKNLYKDVYMFYTQSPKLETTWMSFNWRMDQ